MKLFKFITAIILLLCLCACSGISKGTEGILEELMAEHGKLPEGVVYHMGADEGSRDFLPSAVIRSMYGEEAEKSFSLLEDYSIYISSFAEPYEIAVFKCHSKSDGLRIENMCRQRRDIVSVALRETSFYEMCDDIRIVRKGDTVIFIMCDRPDDISRRAKRLI